MSGQPSIITSRTPAQLVHSGTENTATTIRRTGQTSGAADVHVTGGTVSTDAVEVTGFNGGTVSVGTAAVEVTFTGVTQSFMIQADHDNGTMVYVGGSDVTQAGANSIARLEPGDALTLELNDASAPVYAVGGTTAQKIYKLALT